METLSQPEVDQRLGCEASDAGLRLELSVDLRIQGDAMPAERPHLELDLAGLAPSIGQTMRIPKVPDLLWGPGFCKTRAPGSFVISAHNVSGSNNSNANRAALSGLRS